MCKIFTILISIAITTVNLAGCATNSNKYYGIPKKVWVTMTPEQQTQIAKENNVNKA